MHNETYSNKAANVIGHHQDQILLNWVDDVRKNIPGAEELSKSIIIDTFPVFLSNLMDTLDEEPQENSLNDPIQVAEEHGEERALATPFTFENIQTEYDLLKKNILTFLGDSANQKDLKVLNETIQEAIKYSTEAFMAKKHII